MPAKNPRQPKQVREKLPETAVGKLRQTRSEPAGAVDGKRLLSLIPVVRKPGRPSLAAKFNPTVDIKEALKQLGEGFFTGEEKDLFKTPLKVKPAESQKQRKSAAGLSSSPSRSNKKGAGGKRGSPGSKTSSPDSPYFLRSKGAADEAVDDSLIQRRRGRKSTGVDSAEKESPARKTKSVGLASVEKASPARKIKSVGATSAEKVSSARKATSIGATSAEKESPARRGRKSVQSPPHKKAKPEKPVALVKAARSSSSGIKDDTQENSILDKQRVKSTREDAAEARSTTKSRRQTKTAEDLTSEEFANDAEKAVRVETGKKRKREQDEADDLRAKRAKVMMFYSPEIREPVQEPNQKSTLKLMVHRANIEDLGDKMVLSSDGEQASSGRVEEMRRAEAKRNTQASPLQEASQTKKTPSGRTKGSAAVMAHRFKSAQKSAQNRSSVFKWADSSASTGSVQSSSQASHDLDETARKQLHDLTANISVRSSWSAHLYDRGSSSASKVPQALVAGNSQRTSMDALRPPSAVTPSVDFQLNWDTSAVKEQLVSSVRPQKPPADELATVPKLVTAKEAYSQSGSKGLLEDNEVVITSSVAIPLSRPNIDKPVFERDAVKLGENTRLHTSTKTVWTEEKTEMRRRPSPGRYSAVPFNTPVQPLRGNGASLRRSVDRMLPAVDRTNVVRGRSVEPGMIRSESVHRQPKFNGQMTTKELNPVVEMRGGRCGRVCRRLLCLVGTSVLAIGAVSLAYLALAAGYLGEISDWP